MEEVEERRLELVRNEHKWEIGGEMEMESGVKCGYCCWCWVEVSS